MLLLQATHCLVSTLLCVCEPVFVKHSELEVTASFARAPPTVLSRDVQRCAIKESAKEKNLLAPKPQTTHPQLGQWMLCIGWTPMWSTALKRKPVCSTRCWNAYACHAVQCVSRVHSWVLLVLDWKDGKPHYRCSFREHETKWNAHQKTG